MRLCPEEFHSCVRGWKGSLRGLPPGDREKLNVLMQLREVSSHDLSIRPGLGAISVEIFDSRSSIGNLPGTLDLLILKAVSLGPLHGYGILLRIGQISGRALLIEQGALYPALFRLVRQGLLKASWGTSENNRRAKFYELTPTGRKRLREETDGWNRLAEAIASALAAQPEEI